jgi:hypothetical protein
VRRDGRLGHDLAGDLQPFDQLSHIVLVAEQQMLDHRRRIGIGRA